MRKRSSSETTLKVAENVHITKPYYPPFLVLKRKGAAHGRLGHRACITDTVCTLQRSWGGVERILYFMHILLNWLDWGVGCGAWGTLSKTCYLGLAVACALGAHVVNSVFMLRLTRYRVAAGYSREPSSSDRTPCTLYSRNYQTMRSVSSSVYPIARSRIA